MSIDWLSVECCQSKTKVNHRGHRRPLNQSKLNVSMDMLPKRIPGKIVRVRCDPIG